MVVVCDSLCRAGQVESKLSGLHLNSSHFPSIALTGRILRILSIYSNVGLGSSLRGEPELTTFRSQVCPWKSFLDSCKATHIGGVPGSAAYDKKKHQIALKVSKNWPSFWLCPRKFQRNYLGLGSLVGLGSFAVRPGSCPFFRQIKRKGITLSFNWGWSFTNSGLGLDSGSQILLCRGPRLYKLISVPQPGTLGQGWSPQKRVNRDEWDQR